MSCLKCGAELAADASECPRCGVLVAKARTRLSSTGVPVLHSLDDSVVTPAPVAIRPGSAPNPSKSPYGMVTETMVESLENTRSWVRVIVFSSALTFVLVAVGGAFVYFTIEAMRGKLDNRALISFGAALAISAFSFLLLKDYANAIERIRGGEPTRALEDAIAAQERIWRVQGALTLLGWFLALFLFALSRIG
jgi:hypothetical protein